MFHVYILVLLWECFLNSVLDMELLAYRVYMFPILLDYLELLSIVSVLIYVPTTV